MMLTRRAKIKLLNNVQSRLSWGFAVEIPQGLNKQETDMFMYARYDILRQVYYEIEKMKDSNELSQQA